MQRDNNDELNQKLRRSEMTTKSLDTELNSLKPEFKQLQAESANKSRSVASSRNSASITTHTPSYKCHHNYCLSLKRSLFLCDRKLPIIPVCCQNIPP